MEGVGVQLGGPLRLVVAVPTYQEAEAIPSLLDALSSVAATMTDVDVSVTVIDDASPDGTAEVVERWGATHRGAIAVEVHRRAGRAGLGAAYADGLGRLSRSGRYDLVVQMDADGSHPASALPAMVAAYRAGAHVVVGSRYVPGGSTPGWSRRRRVLSRGANVFARASLHREIADQTGGFNAWDAGLLRALGLDDLLCTGFGVLMEMKHRAVLLGATIAEVPIAFCDRTVGESKLPPSTVVDTVRLVRRLRALGRVPGAAATVAAPVVAPSAPPVLAHAAA